MLLISIVRRITSFIITLLWLGVSAPVLATELTGHWMFVDDGSGVEIKPCPIAGEGLCGVLSQLPKSAAALTPTQRKQLCGVVMIGALKIGKPKAGEQMRLEGWVIDPEDLVKAEQPKRYATSFIMTSNSNARLDVRGPFNIVLESYRLTRPVAQAAVCE
jgi:hypothetical protein